jgi:butyrate kinase
MDLVLTINPGSTSTRAALFSREGRIADLHVQHPAAELEALGRISEQLPLRRAAVADALGPALSAPDVRLVAAVGRGGLLRPLPGGIYPVNAAMLADLATARYGEHASNLGAPLARALGAEHGAPAFIADPVTTDDLLPEARLSGLPEIERRSRAHALNIRACARRAAAALERPLADCAFVVAHLGGGISVAAVRGGAILDTNDALLGMGPFSPERAGALPVGPLVELATSGRYTRAELLERLARHGGLKAYLGTNDLRVVLARCDAGDAQAQLVLRAMVHQVAKEVGAMATVLRGRLDAVVLTGGLTFAEPFVAALRERTDFLGRHLVFPGEGELESLAEAGFRAVSGAEPLRTYEPEPAGAAGAETAGGRA